MRDKELLLRFMVGDETIGNELNRLERMEYVEYIGTRKVNGSWKEQFKLTEKGLKKISKV